MPEFLAETGSLELIYLSLTTVGLVYAILILLGQGIGELDLPGFHLDAGDVPSFDHGEVGLPSISPMSIASFVTAFGAFGLVASELFNATTGVSLLAALGGGIIVGGAAQLLFIYVFSPQTSSLRSRHELAQATAEVITAIPKDGVGQIALVSRGARVTYSARAQPGQSFKQGDVVRVVEIVGNIAFVEPR